MTTYENFKFEVDADGIAVAIWDMPGRSMNVLSQSSMADLDAIYERLYTDPGIKGLVLTNAKGAFCAGADLSMMADQSAGGSSGSGPVRSAQERTRALLDDSIAGLARQRKRETCGKPTVAAINGLALGGGLEAALQCHRRIVADNPAIQLGLPEAKVGLLPGGGGTQRLPRLIGPEAALPLILEGNSVDPHKAKALGIVHDVVPEDQLIAAAKRWIREDGDPVQPWDKPDFRIPGGGPYTDRGHNFFSSANALLLKQTYGNFPALRYIMACVYEGLQVPIDVGLRIEARYFRKILDEPISGNMIRSLFTSPRALRKLARRPKSVPPSKPAKLGVLGAGMMGSGIAYVAAAAGLDVVLLDVTREAAEKGKGYAVGLLERFPKSGNRFSDKKRVKIKESGAVPDSVKSETALDKAVAKGAQSAETRDDILRRIKPTADFADLAGADFVIEAVFEDQAVKADVTKKAETHLGVQAIFGSNTSALPISELAKASVRPENFIGIHFFSPVDRMPLIELIVGAKTSDVALARAMDLAGALRKTPIVVNDRRGFYTSRVVGTYLSEGVTMLGEGMAPAIIDNVGRMTGMPRGPLELSDDVALDLSWKVREQTKKELGAAYIPDAGEGILKALVVDHVRQGRKNAKGFYDYAPGGKKRLWPGLAEIAPVKTAESTPALIATLKERLLYRQALEAARCFEDGVVTDPRDADVGAILGWGFAPWTGGPVSLIDTIGAKRFVEACDRLAADCGARFAPNALLRDMADKGETFYKRFAPTGTA